MATTKAKSVEETLPQNNPIEATLTSGRKKVAPLSKNEAAELRRIVNHPKPPTRALRQAIAEDAQAESDTTHFSKR